MYTYTYIRVYNIISTKTENKLKYSLKLTRCFACAKTVCPPTRVIPAFLNHPSRSILLFRRNEQQRQREKKYQTNRKKSRSILQHRHARFRVRLFPATEQSRVSREYFDANGTPLVVITSQCACTAHKFHGDFTSNHLPRNSSKSLMNKRNKSTVRCSIVIGTGISTFPSFV